MSLQLSSYFSKPVIICFIDHSIPSYSKREDLSQFFDTILHILFCLYHYFNLFCVNLIYGHLELNLYAR